MTTLKPEVACLPHIFFQFFCDDSGTTGPDFIETAQPIYVEAGWILPTANIDEAEQLVMHFEASLPGGAEKKANRVLKTTKGLAATVSLFESLEKVGCLPVFILSEKRYCIAAKMVDTFLDSEYNKSVATEELWDTTGRQKVAEVFYNLPYEKLETFARAYRTNDLNALILSAQDVSAALTGTPTNKLLGSKVLGCIPHLPKMCRLDEQTDDRLPKQGMKALNMPVVVNLFSMLEGHGMRTRTRIAMIHDDTVYQPALERVFHQYKKAKRTHIRLPNGTAHFGYRHLTSLRFLGSVHTPLLRAADFLAGLILSYAVSKINGSQLRPGMVTLASKVVQKAFSYEMGWVLVSYKYARGSLAELLQPV